MANEHSKHIRIAGSEKKPLAGARVRGAIDPQERIEITVLVRARRPAGARFRQTLSAARTAREYFTREEWDNAHGADPADLLAIEEYARRHGLEVIYSSSAERRVVLSGEIGALTKAFPVKLRRVTYKGKAYRERIGPASKPEPLEKIITDVKGFDNRPQAHPHFQLARRRLRPRAAGSKRAFSPVEVGELYHFPSENDGAGECIAIIELGGGYRSEDLTNYFGQLRLPVPAVSAVSVDGARNSPGGEADGEVMLDIEVAAAIAPKARIAVYFAPNTDRGFLDAIKTAVHDRRRRPSVISISWGGAEETWTAQSLRNYDAAFQEAAALGVTITAAAGDHGSSDVDPNDTKNRVDFPAASPFVLACGGTRLEADGTGIASEVVWNNNDNWATGGGVSAGFPLPDWQKQMRVPLRNGRAGRGVPDVAGNADSETGYRVRVNGRDVVIGGTSAVAPLWAGLIAQMNQSLGKPVGYLNPLLYSRAAVRATFHDITKGDNGGYSAGPGWDACTGLGTPNGSDLLAILKTPTARRGSAAKPANEQRTNPDCRSGGKHKNSNP